MYDEMAEPCLVACNAMIDGFAEEWGYGWCYRLYLYVWKLKPSISFALLLVNSSPLRTVLFFQVLVVTGQSSD